MKVHERGAGDRAAMIIGPDGSMTLCDTQGMAVFRMAGVEPETPEVIAARLAWESMHCTECGTRVVSGALYCLECRPYGFWHWMAYFSPLRWRTVRIMKRKSD